MTFFNLGPFLSCQLSPRCFSHGNEAPRHWNIHTYKPSCLAGAFFHFVLPFQILWSIASSHYIRIYLSISKYIPSDLVSVLMRWMCVCVCVKCTYLKLCEADAPGIYRDQPLLLALISRVQTQAGLDGKHAFLFSFLYCSNFAACTDNSIIVITERDIFLSNKIGFPLPQTCCR